MQSQTIGKRRGQCVRLRGEPLEDRRLLAMGDLLRTFANPSTPGVNQFGSSAAMYGNVAAIGALDTGGINPS